MLLLFSFIHSQAMPLYAHAHTLSHDLAAPITYAHELYKLNFEQTTKQNVVQMHYKWNEGVRHHRWATAIKYSPYVPDTRKKEKSYIYIEYEKVHYYSQANGYVFFIYFLLHFFYFYLVLFRIHIFIYPFASFDLNKFSNACRMNLLLHFDGSTWHSPVYTAWK